MRLFHSDPQLVDFWKVGMGCHHHSLDLWLAADGEKSADAPKRVADYIDHRLDHRYLQFLQSTEGSGSAPLFPVWEWG